MYNDKEKKLIDDFFCRNQQNLENPIIKSFLKNRKNYELVANAILDQSHTNRRLVDQSFQAHYLKIKKIKYISNLVHFFSIDYDKRIRRDNQRNLLILDKPLKQDNTTTPKDLIIDERNPSISLGDSLLDHIEDEKLADALTKLSSKQLRILEMLYLENRPLKEVAEMLQLSAQNTSNHHRKALRKLYKYYTGG